MNEPVITIDGASGTGKGTVSQLLANRLEWHFLDSGALYRVLGLAAYRHGFSLEALDQLQENELPKDVVSALKVLAEHLDVQFIAGESNNSTIILEGENVTNDIRTEQIGNAASIVGQMPVVRAALLSRQRAFRRPPGLVADGRDMGTVVFPDAELKIFLTASTEERSQRRFNQLKEKGINVTLSNLVEELHKRDKRDQERSVAPLRPADDAICINTDHLSINQVVERILYEIRQKKAFPVISDLQTALVEASG